MTRRKFSRSTRKKEKDDSKKLVNPWNWYPPTWNMVFIATCVLGVISDPLFLYVPTINSGNMDDSVYETICNYAKPVIYAEKSYVIRRGEPVDLLLLVTQGTLWSFESEIDPTKRIQKGDFWGDEVFEWRLRTTSYSELPLSKSNLICHTKVEGFALMAVNLDRVLSNCWAKFSSNSDVFDHFAAATVQKGFRRLIRKKRANENSNKLAIITSNS